MTLQRDLRQRNPVVGTWLSIGHPAVAEIAAGSDLDFVVLDTEHSPTDLETAENMLRAVEAAGGTALARVPWNDPVRIKRLLDAGPSGLVVPMVETATQAREAVAAMRYPPEGDRGVAAARAAEYGRSFEEYVTDASDDLLTVVQVETETGVGNAGDIAAVEGVDALFVGPADLSSSLGSFPDWHDERAVDAVGTVVEAADAAGVAVGTLAAGPDEVDTWLDRGMDFLAVGTDAGMLVDATDEAAAAFERATD
ncbi:MAG: aldolase/citrate lyase family protein [Halobacteriales archaeon]